MAKTKKEETLAKSDEEVLVTLETSEAKVLKYNQEGKVLRFDAEHFKVLPDEIVRDLSHDNTRNYFVMYNQHLAIEKEKKEGNFGKPRIHAESLQIIDPLGGHAGAKLSFKVKDTQEGKDFEKKYHVYAAAAWEVEDRKDLGYEILSNDDPVVTRGNSTSSESRVIRNKNEDELVWMKVDKRKYEQHIEASAAKSRAIVRGVPTEFAGKLEEVSKGKAKPLEVDEEVEKVTMNEAQFRATEGK